MPKYIEFRVLLPMTVEEYQVAQLYSVAQASKNETGGGEGIEVISNEPFNGHPDPPLMEGYDKGQYTYKCYHIEHKIPSAIRALSPKNSLQFFEEAWNAYPYCRTVVDNKYMKDNFVLKIESMHVDNDLGELENVHQLTPDKLNKRRICKIDIANDPVSRSDYKADEDPTKFKSEKTGRGPLEGKEWHKKVTPIMCAYKLVTYEFKWFGLQTLVESFIERAERRLFTTFHRQLFCWMDKWYGLTMTDIRRIEDETKLELDNARHQGERRGLVEK